MNGHSGGMIRPGPKEGFTLLEILVAMAILGILTTFTILRWSALLPTFRLNSAARQIHSELHNLRGKAAAENVSFQLVYSEGNPNYTTKRDGVPQATKTLPRGTVISRAGKISFSPRGTASANRVRIRNIKGTCSQIIVSPTGRIRICKSSGCDASC